MGLVGIFMWIQHRRTHFDWCNESAIRTNLVHTLGLNIIESHHIDLSALKCQQKLISSFQSLSLYLRNQYEDL
jgi:hypothetical protein